MESYNAHRAGNVTEGQVQHVRQKSERVPKRDSQVAQMDETKPKSEPCWFLVLNSKTRRLHQGVGCNMFLRKILFRRCERERGCWLDLSTGVATSTWESRWKCYTKILVQSVGSTPAAPRDCGFLVTAASRRDEEWPKKVPW